MVFLVQCFKHNEKGLRRCVIEGLILVIRLESFYRAPCEESIQATEALMTEGAALARAAAAAAAVAAAALAIAAARLQETKESMRARLKIEFTNDTQVKHEECIAFLSN